jgi:hypothetical protein
VLVLVDRGQKTEDRAVLLDATGRKVLVLLPGSNDVRMLCPGVYFVRQQESRNQGVTDPIVQKVIVAR